LPGPVGEEPGFPFDVGKPVECGQFSPVERIRQQSVGDVPAGFLDIEPYTGTAAEGETDSLTRVSDREHQVGVRQSRRAVRFAAVGAGGVELDPGSGQVELFGEYEPGECPSREETSAVGMPP